ncbi:hypothetical protein [Pectobacterium versatile]|uniref:hypothetical protein n=1 Tax=Pectobacterium versatile TaxID=2488639 RepID=UPI002B24BE9B|nr:hypothetical protein [Pectobacterium versatile]
MLASHLRRHSKELINENNMFGGVLVTLAQRKLLLRGLVMLRAVFCIESQIISHKHAAKESRDLRLCKMNRTLDLGKEKAH